MRRVITFGLIVFLMLIALKNPISNIALASISNEQLLKNADFNEDGTISLADFEIFRTLIGKNTSTSDLQITPVVPTPTTAPATEVPTVISAPNSTTDHWRGSTSAQFILVEFGDFQCPFCKKLVPTITTLLSTNAGKIAFVWRHFPLSFHTLAQSAAEASECAADQGGNDAFWNMHDAIFAAMPNMTSSQFVTLAQSIGLNTTTFSTCFGTHKYKSKVLNQLNEGQNIGIAATPTIIVYNLTTGKTIKIEGALPLESIQSTLNLFMSQ